MEDKFATRLQIALQKAGMTQKELAERICVTEATLSRYISGDREPKAETIANIATALHTTSDYLLGIEQEGFDFANTKRIIARNAQKMTTAQKKELLDALFGGD